MTPLLTSGQIIRIRPLDEGEPRKGDVVIAKVNGRVYCHRVTGIKGSLYQISNNHGHVNGWTSRDNIYGIWA